MVEGRRGYLSTSFMSRRSEFSAIVSSCVKTPRMSLFRSVE